MEQSTKLLKQKIFCKCPKNIVIIKPDSKSNSKSLIININPKK